MKGTTVNKFAASAKKTWDARKGQIAVAGIVTTVAVTALLVRNQSVINDFLSEHDLLDTYYALNES